MLYEVPLSLLVLKQYLLQQHYLIFRGLVGGGGDHLPGLPELSELDRTKGT